MNERDKKENIQVSDAARSSEFALIDTYFKNKTLLRSDVDLGIGDDAALLAMPSQQLLAVAMDTLVEGIHFPVKTSAYDIGYKSLAVNLSDLAAMGAQPAWLSLALTMPEADLMWLQQFSEGLFYLANQYGMQLVGGDTTRGPLTITVQVCAARTSVAP
jgi:thiamine-monophosphate kinase